VFSEIKPHFEILHDIAKYTWSKSKQTWCLYNS